MKYGDGGANVSPILRLFKSQVYQSAEYLGLPWAIQVRPPTTGPYSAGSPQQEFFLRAPVAFLDAVWNAYELGAPAGDIAKGLGLAAEQVERVINEIFRKKRKTSYLRAVALSL